MSARTRGSPSFLQRLVSEHDFFYSAAPKALNHAKLQLKLSRLAGYCFGLSTAFGFCSSSLRFRVEPISSSCFHVGWSCTSRISFEPLAATANCHVSRCAHGGRRRAPGGHCRPLGLSGFRVWVRSFPLTATVTVLGIMTAFLIRPLQDRGF